MDHRLALAALGLLALGAVLFAWVAGRRVAAARADAAAARAVAETHARALGLLAQDLAGPGLALLGQADRLAGGAAVAVEARRILALADGIAEHLAAAAGPRPLRPEALPLAPLLAEAVAATAAQLGPAARHWRIGAEFDALTLQADRRALRGALLPVLGRAARQTRDGDCIGLRAVLTPEALSIVIEDEGAGLPAADLAVVAAMEPGAGRTRGLDFGLATARSLLEAHGGSLRLETLPGVGARAWLTLPRERLLAPAPERPA